MKKIGAYFLQGLLYIAPLGLTIYVTYLLFMFIDGLLQSTLERYLPFSVPGLGFVLLLVIITLLGFVGQTIIARPFKLIISRVMERAPLVKVLYSSLRDLLSAFVGKERKFNRPVLVRVNTISDLEKMGFLTQSDLSELQIKDKVAVYFPHSYNFSGELFIVPSELVRPLDIPSAEAMKFIVSGGVTRV